MSWNRTNTVSSALSATGAGKRNIIRGIIAGAIVVIAATACWFFLVPSTPSKLSKPTKHSSLIKEVTPAPAPRLTERDWANLSLVELRRVKPEETNRLSAAQIAIWKRHHPWPPPNPKQMRRPKSEWKIFHNLAENQIAGLLNVAPGMQIVGARTYDERFVKSFLKSVAQPIVISDGDSEYEKNLKQAVKDAKIQLKEAYDRGEDICKLMQDTFNELQRLGQFKNELERMALRQINKKGTTAADAEDTISAVNKMLEEKGIAPIGEHSISMLSVRLNALKEKENKK